MLHGPAAQLRADGRLQPGCYGVQAVDVDCAREIYGPAQGYGGKYNYDLTGQVLKDSLAVEAQKTEFYFCKSIYSKPSSAPDGHPSASDGRTPARAVRWSSTTGRDWWLDS